MSAMQKWLLALALTALAVVASYFWLDRPLALMAHALAPAHKHALFEPLTHLPDPLMPAAAIAFVALGLAVLAGRPLARFPRVLVLCSFSLVMGHTVKDELKPLFGRTWPETWVENNPSFIHDQVYGFHWLHGGAGYEFLSLRPYDRDLRADLGAVALLSALSAALCAGRAGGRRRAHWRRFPFPQ